MGRRGSKNKNQANSTRKVGRGPEKLSEILADLIIRRGYARQLESSRFQQAWNTVVENRLANHSCPGNLRRGVLEVSVENSIVMQELTFQKNQILKKLNQEMENENRSPTIHDIRFRIGAIG